MSNQPEINREYIILDTATIQTRTFGWLNLDSICRSVRHLHCSSISSDYIPSMHNYLSTKAYNASLTEMIYLHNIESPHSFLVIFDSGAILAISPNEEDFVGPIVPFQIKRRLGGMDGGIFIADIGSIKLSFRVGKKLIVRSMWYHIPNSKAQLSSPQRLFNKSKGAVGCFTCLEEYAILSFNGIYNLTIDYDSRSYLHVALATKYQLKEHKLTYVFLTKTTNTSHLLRYFS